MDQPGSCKKCQRAATVTVTLGFAPGGNETMPLCSQHTWELYETITRWFGAGSEYVRKGESPSPEYIKTDW